MNKFKLLLILPLTSLFAISGCASIKSKIDPLGSANSEVKDLRLVIRSFTKELQSLTKEIEILKKKTNNSSQPGFKEHENIYCSGNLMSSVTKVDKTILPEGYADLDDYQLTADFRRPSKKYPFSKALAYNDPVTGQSVAVRDQNFIPGGSKVSSLWGRYNIAMGGYWVLSTQSGLFSEPYISFIPFEANILFIPNGDNFLIVKGCNGRFKVTKEVANALLNHDETKNAYVRFSTEENGAAHLTEIGKDTVKAWKKVYANWKAETNLKIENIGF